MHHLNSYTARKKKISKLTTEQKERDDCKLMSNLKHVAKTKIKYIANKHIYVAEKVNW